MNYWLTFKLNLQVCHYKYQNQICLLPRIMSSESNLIKLHLPTIQSDWNISQLIDTNRYEDIYHITNLRRLTEQAEIFTTGTLYFWVYIMLSIISTCNNLPNKTRCKHFSEQYFLLHHHSWLSNPAKFIKLVQIWLIDMIVHFKSTTINHRSLQVLMGVWRPTTLGTLFEGNPHAIKCTVIQGI